MREPKKLPSPVSTCSKKLRAELEGEDRCTLGYYKKWFL